MVSPELHYYYSGRQMIETRNADAGGQQTLKQHVWGLQYVDELLQIAVNGDPATDNDCLETGGSDASYWALQDANYNVLGIVDSEGGLAERYEYTPYGQRTVYKSTGSDDPLCMSPILESQRVTADSSEATYGLCDIGHQGLMHDKEFGLIYNRRRYLDPVLGRYTTPDPLNANEAGGGYQDGMSRFESRRSNPVGRVDPSGLLAGKEAIRRVDNQSWRARSKYNAFKAALQEYSREAARLRTRFKNAVDKGEECPELDLARAKELEKIAADRLREYISAQKEMWWKAKSFFAESDAIWPWERGKLKWFFKAVYRNPHPWRLPIKGHPQLAATWKGWQNSYHRAINAADVEAQRVFKTTDSLIETAETVEIVGESALAVTGFGYAAKKVFQEGGKRALVWFVAKSAARIALTEKVAESKAAILRQMGLSDEQIKAVELLGHFWRIAEGANRLRVKLKSQGLTTPKKYFENQTKEQAEAALQKKYGSPRSVRPEAKTYHNPETGRSYNIHQQPGHQGGRPHVDIRKRGNFPERKYPLREE